MAATFFAPQDGPTRRSSVTMSHPTPGMVSPKYTPHLSLIFIAKVLVEAARYVRPNIFKTKGNFGKTGVVGPNEY